MKMYQKIYITTFILNYQKITKPIILSLLKKLQNQEVLLITSVINNEDLNKGILKIRYLNNRKLTNPILNKDYQISKNMINAIKYNKDIHKLSKNEMKVYPRITKSFKQRTRYKYFNSFIFIWQ